MGLLRFSQRQRRTEAGRAREKPAAGGTDFFGTPKPETTDQSYTVVSGDSLSKIAKNHYGDAAKWPQIYEANKAIIGNNPDHIEVGQVLTLPSL